MGKYKELDVIYNNLDSKEKELINSYNNEFIKVRDKEVPLNIYILKSKNVICLMESVGTAHLWTWHDFKEETKGRLLSYKTEQNVIINELFEMDKEPTEEILEKYNLKKSFVLSSH